MQASGKSFSQRPGAQGLYDPQWEHDACGVGFLANLDGQPTHEIVARGVETLQNLLHRGAVGGDQKTGDGAGLLLQIPDAFLREELKERGVVLPKAGTYGVGMFFMPRDTACCATCMSAVVAAVKGEGLQFLGWRDVPTNENVLGRQAFETRPVVKQAFVDGGGASGAELDRKLYVIRKLVQQRVKPLLPPGEGFYVASFSNRTIVYKGMLMGGQVSGYYRDLVQPSVTSAVAVVHQRYSTNTFPSWDLAQPFRHLAHNGEINTLRGNINQMQAREQSLACDAFGADIKRVLPVIDPNGSDSASLDNVLELLTKAGRSLPHAMMMLIPEAWGVKYPAGPDQKGFFEYHAGLMEPWDGPATVAFTDGEMVGAILDRNGLRPARYTITRSGFMVLASEAGVLEFAPEEIAEKGALRPGQIIVVDLAQKRVLKNAEIKSHLARRQPYRRWVEEHRISIQGLFGAVAPVVPEHTTLLARQKLFGYTREDVGVLLEPMASKGHEAVGSMGHDVPLAVLSEKPQLLFHYFKQLFAQVTNPPIDPIREELVMSLMTFIGNPPNILTELPTHARLLKLRHPVLVNEDMARIRTLHLPGFQAKTIPIGFPAGGDGEELSAALRLLVSRAEAAVGNGDTLLILSDRNLPPEEAPIPSLLAVSAVNRHLIERGVRTGVGLLVESGDPREVMHLALLLGYGATAVNPYLAFETVAQLAERGELAGEINPAKAIENYIAALCEGLRKIMSKMGIATLRGYRGAQVFEAVGISAPVVEAFFTGTASRVGGIGLAEIAAEANERWQSVQDPSGRSAALLPSGGQYRWRQDGERHLWTTETITRLQQATRTNQYPLFREYAKLINEQTLRQSTLRGLFRFKATTPVPLEEVEPAEQIMRRFVTGAMSFGSISREAHETIAIAMNRIGGRSNSGEGGEDPARYRPDPNGDNRCSAIKQVASGRFGVTTEYCVNARELQIKIAQGAKPGEGGQLPGHKVNEEIARVRHSTPGVTLISPPPHHDIYSIEDIKQLIYDLRNVNPQAEVSVKLVSELGVGTIAAGVAKAEADRVLISGYDGGTGASPLSSIKHAGAPWELGLAETHQTLQMNDLRDKIKVQVDGQIKTGRDVIIGALLGAEEFGFATAALVCMGCVMMRKCHQNTCPVGVATQDPKLRGCFQGRPEYLVNFARFLAEETREYLAQLGFRTLDEAIGRVDLLEMNDAIRFWKARGLDFTRILFRPDTAVPARCVQPRQHDLSGTFDARLLPQIAPAIEGGTRVELRAKIRNVHRTFGAMIAGAIARRHGHAGLPEDTVTLRLEGTAGQSFGAWATHGMTLELTGEANDYVGKGLSGGKIVVRAPSGVRYDAEGNTIAGNVLLYGAIAGEAYFGGAVGERFAIRNSGARAVVEGVGDHGCEYMTGGRVVVLGRTGLNFAAGMSGGIAYVYDTDGLFDVRCNLEMVDLEPVRSAADRTELRRMIERHVRFTGSRAGQAILERWEEALPRFVKVFPMEYRRVLGQMMQEDEMTEREEVTHG
jgi:glutamate synthase domain-containing protein 2/glutamate synthase domain-containing protein 1/glutamate synthase domain-containing protein 3